MQGWRKGWNTASPGADFPGSRDSTPIFSNYLESERCSTWKLSLKGQPCSSTRHKHAQARSLACGSELMFYSGTPRGPALSCKSRHPLPSSNIPTGPREGSSRIGGNHPQGRCAPPTCTAYLQCSRPSHLLKGTLFKKRVNPPPASKDIKLADWASEMAGKTSGHTSLRLLGSNHCAGKTW